MNPRRIEKFFVTTEYAPQIRMKLKFNTKSDSYEIIRAVRRIKWSPTLKEKVPVQQKPSDYLGMMKLKVQEAYKKLKRSYTESHEPPPCCLIIAIDETKMFSQSHNGSIQPKLRRAVNDLILKLLNRLKRVGSPEITKEMPYRDDVGIVVVRFGGTEYEYKPESNTDEVNLGPFGKQMVGQFDKKGTSIYEFAPVSHAVFTVKDIYGEDLAEDEDPYEDLCDLLDGSMPDEALQEFEEIPGATNNDTNLMAGATPGDFDIEFPNEYSNESVSLDLATDLVDHKYGDSAEGDETLDFEGVCEEDQDMYEEKLIQEFANDLGVNPDLLNDLIEEDVDEDDEILDFFQTYRMYGSGDLEDFDLFVSYYIRLTSRSACKG